MLTSDYEKVHTVDDYWDQPRIGVADYEGRPHYYQCVFDEAKDDWSNVYLLKPLDDELFQLCLEIWKSWLRWQAAYREGRVSQESHPTLPADQERRAEISTVLGNRLVADPDKDLKAEGEFKAVEFAPLDECKEPHPKSWKVKWRLVS